MSKEEKPTKKKPKVSREVKISKYADKITANSTTLLMIAVVFYFITLLFNVFVTFDPATGDPIANVYLLGMANLGANNIVVLTGIFAQLFAVFGALLMAFMRLFAGLSFAAVCFDESKNIWFRVVAVAALMLIMFGGLNIF